MPVVTCDTARCQAKGPREPSAGARGQARTGHRGSADYRVPAAVIALSRILYDTEALVVANTNPNGPWNGYVIVDRDINPAGSTLTALWPAGAPDLPVSQRTTVTVAEPDGSTGTGPLSVVPVQLAPLQTLVATSAPSAGF